MKRKYKHGNQTEAAKNKTSQGTSSPSQSPPQSLEAHNNLKIPPAVLVASAPAGESPVKAKGVGGMSAVHAAPKKESDRSPSVASSSELEQHSGSAQAEEELVSMPQMVREEIEPVVEALRDIDLWGLPVCPAGDTIRGLVWALEYVISPRIRPRCQHHVPFNLSISQEEEALGQAAINEVFQISATLLVGLRFLQTRGYVSEWGAECPACWSPGDFCSAIEDARDALGRLEVLNDKLYNFKWGTLPKHTDKIGSSSAIPKTH